jgi:hypothetical protein
MWAAPIHNVRLSVSRTHSLRHAHPDPAGATRPDPVPPRNAGNATLSPAPGTAQAPYFGESSSTTPTARLQRGARETRPSGRFLAGEQGIDATGSSQATTGGAVHPVRAGFAIRNYSETDGGAQGIDAPYPVRGCRRAGMSAEDRIPIRILIIAKLKEEPHEGLMRR